MSARHLVWPWHGPVSSGQITLSDDSTRAYPQPPDSTDPGVYTGPGDCHLIEVPDVPEITDAEAAAAPAGGEWWAGKAIITGRTLYGQQLDGWIYQSSPTKRWHVRLRDVVLTDDQTVGEFVVRPFGAWYQPLFELTQGFVLPVGRATYLQASGVFAPIVTGRLGVLRLHSVSPSGQHAVLGLYAWQNASSSPSSALDRKPRPYHFWLVSVTGEDEDIALTVTHLYGLTDIRETLLSPAAGAKHVVDSPARGTEMSREPVYEEGEYIGDRVSYWFDEEPTYTPSVSAVSFPVPGTDGADSSWMWGVRFDGETPVPLRVRCAYSRTVQEPAFEWQTVSPIVRLERTSGGIEVEDAGTARLIGTAVSETLVTITGEGGAATWSRSHTLRAESTVEDGVVSNRYLLDAREQTVGGLDHGDVSPLLSMDFTVYGAGNRPALYAGVGHETTTVLSLSYLLDPFANGCLGVAQATEAAGGAYQGALTPQGWVVGSGNYSETNLQRYGSYNPVTGDVSIGALAPVNWI